MCERWDYYSNVLDFSWGCSTMEISQILVEFYIQGRQEDGLTPAKALINAMGRDREELMYLVLDKWFGSDTTRNGSAGDAVHDAVSKGRISLLKILVRHPVGKAAINEKISNIGTPLHAAVSTKETGMESMDILLNEGADAGIVAGTYGTILNVACFEGNYDIAKKLLQKLSWDTITSITGKYGNPMQSAIARYRTRNVDGELSILEMLDLFKHLEEHGVSPMVIGGYYCTTLHAASHCKVPKEVLTWLLDRASPSLLVKDPVGRLPLHMAISRGDWEAIKQILRYTEQMLQPYLRGSAVFWEYRDFQHLTGLHYAAISKSETTMFRILELCTKDEIHELVNLKDKDGWTPLHWACRGNNLEVVKTLIDNGATANLRTNEGWTPRQIAIFHGVDNEEYLNLLPELAVMGERLPEGQAKYFGGWCDACYAVIYWYYYHCNDAECDDFDLCFKCYKSANSIHDNKHEFLYRS
ncbi:ankyrin repeat-containing domain protein [Trichoderma ceciliae]